MKRKIMLITILMTLICVTGCSQEKKLNCIKEEKLDKVETIQTIDIIFKKNKIKKIYLTNKYKLEKKHQEYKKMYIKEIEKNYEDYKNMKGISLKIEENTDGFILKLNGTVRKMNKSSKEKLQINNSIIEIEAIKKQYKKDNYICK